MEPPAAVGRAQRLPADDHVHTEFSWDAADGSMIESCRRAVELGLPSIAFTEHVDLAAWSVPEQAIGLLGRYAEHLGADGRLRAPELDVEGYLASVERCRREFPELRIVTGVELGEPHRFPDEAEAVLAAGSFERILGSVHTLVGEDACRLVDEWFVTEQVDDQRDGDAVRVYLAESLRLAESSFGFEVFAHIDYLTRQIVRSGRRHDPAAAEEEYRAVLRALARSDRVLEVNTTVGLDPVVVRWWREEGGRAVSFGSDAHSPGAVGRGFRQAAEMAEAAGFRRGADPADFWTRS